jgi:hypothetical protein
MGRLVGGKTQGDAGQKRREGIAAVLLLRREDPGQKKGHRQDDEGARHRGIIRGRARGAKNP